MSAQAGVEVYTLSMRVSMFEYAAWVGSGCASTTMRSVIFSRLLWRGRYASGTRWEAAGMFVFWLVLFARTVGRGGAAVEAVMVGLDTETGSSPLE